MRTLVDLNDGQVTALDTPSKAQKQSRAALIRQAVDEFLARYRRDTLGSAFGLWADRDIDGLEYQRKLRDKW